MSVLDAMALVAVLAEDPADREVRPLIANRDEAASIAGPNLAEVVDVLVRKKGVADADVAQAIQMLRIGGLEVAAAGEHVGMRAGELRARHYHRTRCPISMCDCIALATAQEAGVALATADQKVAAVARAEGISVIELPNSRGVRP